MSTNVYRAEERTYFDPDNPCIMQGYYMSTTCGGVGIYTDENTWAVLETRAEEMFPECDCVRVAGFATVAYSSSDYSDEAYEALAEEIAEYTDMDAVDVVECLIHGKTLAEIVESEGE
jgi:hypothetical protein